MPDETLTMVETSVLLILMSEAASVPNAKLAKEYHCELKKASREKLEDWKLIEVKYASRQLFLALTDKGWARCRIELDAGTAPSRSGAAGGALYAVLGLFGRYLTVRGASLADFVGVSNGADAATGSPVQEQVPITQDAEERVRAAYQEIAPRPSDLVSLADLRDRISDLAPADVDAALRRLNRRRDVVLVPEANQKTLDARTRAAAVVIGDQPKHSISMGAS
jgi:hypothetical protein